MIYGTKKEILSDIGKRLRARRLLLNMSQQSAAERSGISVVTLQNLEKGRGSSLWAMVSLCRTYDHTNWIFELAPEERIEHRIVESGEVRRVRASKRRRSADV